MERHPAASPGTAVVKLLVLADTHLGRSSLHRMPPDVWAMADAVYLVLHAGDVVEREVIDELARRAPVHAVLGNNDRSLSLPERLELDLAGVRVAMVHESGPRAGRTARLRRMFPEARLIVYGHSHEPHVEQVDGGPLLLNPGSPTQRRRQPVHTVATVELDAGTIVDARLVPVGPLVRRPDHASG